MYLATIFLKKRKIITLIDKCCRRGVYHDPWENRERSTDLCQLTCWEIKFYNRFLPPSSLHMEGRTWGISQEKQSFRRRLTTVSGSHIHIPERMPLFSDLSQSVPCFLLGCHREPGGLTRCYVSSASRTSTVQTKMCSSAQDNWLQTSLTAEATWPGQRPGSKAGTIRSTLKGQKKSCLLAPQPSLSTTNSSGHDCHTQRNHPDETASELHHNVTPTMCNSGSQRGLSSWGAMEFSTFYFLSPIPALAPGWDEDRETTVRFSSMRPQDYL